VPAVNNHGAFGRWAFLEPRDPWNAQSDIAAGLSGTAGRLPKRQG
jgi:type III restriction enzyme